VKRALYSLLFVAIAVVAALAGYFLNPVSNPGIDVETLLATSLPDLQGQRRKVGDWKGKVLVVNFWATWCEPCVEEVPQFVRLQALHGEKGVQFVGIAVDQAAKVQDFAKTYRINYPLLIGQAGAIELARAAGNARGGLPTPLCWIVPARFLLRFMGLSPKRRWSACWPGHSDRRAN
jgi:thiol-disulfide isomerase/thioredoxin